MTSQEYDGASPFDVPSPIFGDQSSQVVDVSSYSPHRGLEGGKIHVYFHSVYDFLSRPSTTFALEFGSKRCECVVDALGPDESTFHYALSAVIPPFISTGYPSFATPLKVVMDDQDGQEPQIVQVGVFTYDQVHETPVESASSDGSRKRKISSETDESSLRSSKKSASQQIQIKADDDSFSYSDSLSHSPYSPFLQTPTTANVYPVQRHATSSPRLLQAQ